MDMDYTFKEIAITLNGTDYLASGSVGVEFDMEPEDRSVGVVGGAIITGFGRVIADLIDENGETAITIDAKDGAAVDAILHALDHDEIAIACDESASGVW